ncbi:hypothetical protein LCGC14_0514560 [marine sediment metagenome]|uniref:Uncharacterized protein n=1 Tax=marine sediment metagenome TaxID=412755 RepID=A0A0F9SIN5_9ZZZZ
MITRIVAGVGFLGMIVVASIALFANYEMSNSLLTLWIGVLGMWIFGHLAFDKHLKN